MKFFIFFWLIALALVAAAPPSRAGDDADCGAAMRAHIGGYIAIARGMADYKAAIDAGYAACSARYPEEFAGTAEGHGFLAENTEDELTQARAVIDRLIDDPDPKKVPAACREDEAARQSVRKDAARLIDGQYKKAYDRRHKALSAAQSFDASKADSCKLVREMVGQYAANFDRYAELRHVLYESSRKQVKNAGGADGRTYRRFEKIRGELAAAKP